MKSSDSSESSSSSVTGACLRLADFLGGIRHCGRAVWVGASPRRQVTGRPGCGASTSTAAPAPAADPAADDPAARRSLATRR
eukprot:scaffold71276_cov54-Phaeocystis_antarctica.AAC.2